MKKNVWVYQLRSANGELSTVILDDCSDNLTIGGYDDKGKYVQYDSYEGFYAHGFFAEKHPSMHLECMMIEIDVPNLFEGKVL